MRARLSLVEALENRTLLAVTLVERSLLDTPGSALASERVGDLVYVADQDFGITVYSVAVPAVPVQVATFQTASSALDITIENGRAYVASARGMEILDVSDLRDIRSLGVFSSAENIRSVEVQNGLAYLGAATSLSIVNVTDPADPVLVSRLTNIGASDLQLAGDALYAADATRGVRAVSIADPANPLLISTNLNGFNVIDVEAQDGFLFVATQNNGIFSYNIAGDPGNPLLISSEPALSDQFIRSIDLSGANLFVATSTSIFVVDALLPATIQPLAQLDLPQAVVEDVFVGGGSILLSSGSPGVRLIEARDTIAFLDAGILQVTGTAAGDRISIRAASNSELLLERNGVIQRVSTDVLQGIRINALAGADRVEIARGLPSTVGGGSGQDTIVTSSGRDSVRGGRGGDVIDTRSGGDIVFGEEGMDRIFGGSGDDFLSGGLGDDTIQAGLGNDVLRGGEDQDSLVGGDGDDQLFGNAGNDTLVGKAGTDRFSAGIGFDSILARDGIVDWIYANVLQDAVDADAADRINEFLL